MLSIPKMSKKCEKLTNVTIGEKYSRKSSTKSGINETGQRHLYCCRDIKTDKKKKISTHLYPKKHCKL